MAGALSVRSSPPVTKLWAVAILQSLRADQQGQYEPLVVEGDYDIQKVTRTWSHTF